MTICWVSCWNFHLDFWGVTSGLWGSKRHPGSFVGHVQLVSTCSICARTCWIHNKIIDLDTWRSFSRIGMGSYLVFGRFWCVKVIKYTEKDLLLVGCMWILFQIIEQRTSGLVVHMTRQYQAYDQIELSPTFSNHWADSLLAASSCGNLSDTRRSQIECLGICCPWDFGSRPQTELRGSHLKST